MLHQASLTYQNVTHFSEQLFSARGNTHGNENYLSKRRLREQAEKDEKLALCCQGLGDENNIFSTLEHQITQTTVLFSLCH